jgi:hypothetical protein
VLPSDELAAQAVSRDAVWRALDPRKSQIRRAAQRAGLLIVEAEATLEEASGVIANGYLRLDPQEWIRAVEKRRAAEIAIGASGV